MPCCRSRRAFRWPTFPSAAWRCSATAPTPAACRTAAAALARAVADAEGDFSMELFEPDAAVVRAMQRGEPGAPVVLADTQDNPGAGGNGDTTGLLAALLARRAPRRGAGAADRSGLGRAGACRRRRPQGDVRARRDFRRAGTRAARRRIHGAGAGRRAIYLHRADVPGLPHGPGADGAAGKGRRARRARVEQVPGRRPGNVPPRRHRAADESASWR